jgi:phytoene dehydrogenase-like protein
MPGSSVTAGSFADVYDAVVIGAGHNGLAAAAYLARAAMRVLVLERLPHTGGAAVSEAPWRGRSERVSRYSYLVSLLPDEIARDLGIDVELRARRVSACAPAGGRCLIVDDPATSERSASSLGVDHQAWLDFYAMTSAAAERLFPTLTRPLPSREEARRLMGDAWEPLVERPLADTLAERFSDGLVRGVVSTDGLIGTFAGTADESLRQNRCFLYHVIGRGDGRWRVPVGGMGAITAALERSARAAGAEIRTNAVMTGVEHGPQTSHVAWDGGSATTRWVLTSLVPEDPPEGSQTKVNMLLDRLPRLRCGIAPEDAFAGTFRLYEHEDEIAAAYAQAARGEIPAKPPAELYCHTLTDRSTLGPDAPPGLNSLTLFGLHTPASLFRDDEQRVREILVERYLDALDELLDEPIRDCLARDAEGAPCIEARTPLDLERELGMRNGNIFHGDLRWPWAEDDAEAGSWGVESGHPRVVLCGSAARRGGGVSCIGGHNAAMAVLAVK